jgi:hypothetical protein
MECKEVSKFLTGNTPIMVRAIRIMKTFILATIIFDAGIIISQQSQSFVQNLAL